MRHREVRVQVNVAKPPDCIQTIKPKRGRPKKKKRGRPRKVVDSVREVGEMPKVESRVAWLDDVADTNLVPLPTVPEAPSLTPEQ